MQFACDAEQGSHTPTSPTKVPAGQAKTPTSVSKKDLSAALKQDCGAVSPKKPIHYGVSPKVPKAAGEGSGGARTPVVSRLPLVPRDASEVRCCWPLPLPRALNLTDRAL
jgi:hypothetical protein